MLTGVTSPVVSLGSSSPTVHEAVTRLRLIDTVFTEEAATDIRRSAFEAM